jgi:hypothetical protein
MTEVKPILDLLREENATTTGSFEVSAADNISDAVRRAIEAADAVIVVFDAAASNVLFEAGIAYALRKQTLFLLRYDDVPPPLAGFSPFLRFTGSVTDVLTLGVQGFLGTIMPNPHARSTSKETETGSTRPQLRSSLSDEIARLRTAPNPSELEKLVASVLKSTGVTSVQQRPRSENEGADFVVWSDALRGSLGNPVLVEVKGKLDAWQFEDAYGHLARLVAGSQSAAGVLLFLREAGQRVVKPRDWNPSVMWFDVAEFAVDALARGFATTVVERRNQIVHGLGF